MANKIVYLAGSPAASLADSNLHLFNFYEANAHSESSQAGLEKSILVNDILLSLVFITLISSMKIED